MRTSVIAAILVASYCLVRGAPIHAQESGGLLSPEQRRAYHACLYAAWVADYCKENSRAINACIVANGGGRFPLGDRRYTDDYCWFAAHDVSSR
jgi:hypothetical protein